jgi:2,3-bisphosphoglycerate-dependent phosphoglycerate mutase
MKRLILLICISCCSFGFTQAQDLTTFILVRHAEKGTDDPRDPKLSQVGEMRAQRLNERLKFSDISAIYSTPYIRTKSTVKPLATAKGLEVNEYDYKKPDLLTEMVAKHNGGTIVISGHSNTTPMLVNQLIGEEKFEWLQEDEYDKIFIVTISAVGKGTYQILSY